jgi:hypothetical protein
VQKTHFADGALYDQIVGETLMAAARTFRVLPGFNLTLGYTLGYCRC